ncbi:MAG: hypothetical protein M3Q19_14000 [Pseudomonadota bacterium]|nr:hypothetical protein [Pseudomonadota bacterium]
MRYFVLAPALASGLALAACDYNKGDYNEAEANYSAEGNAYDEAAGGAGYNAATSWPEGARIVEEDGVFYRIDTGGTRVRLEPNDARIVVEEGVRFRVDPDGTRVRIDDEGLTVRVAPGDVDATVNTGDTSVTVNNQ